MGQLEQILHHARESAALAQGDIQVLGPGSRIQLLPFQTQGLQVAVYRRQRGTQVVGAPGHQLPAQPVLLLELGELGDDAPGHVVESAAQALDLIGTRALPAPIGLVAGEAATPESCHHTGETPQAAGQQMEQQ